MYDYIIIDVFGTMQKAVQDTNLISSIQCLSKYIVNNLILYKM